MEVSFLAVAFVFVSLKFMLGANTHPQTPTGAHSFLSLSTNGFDTENLAHSTKLYISELLISILIAVYKMSREMCMIFQIFKPREI